jgi:hypothetical protein
MIAPTALVLFHLLAPHAQASDELWRLVIRQYDVPLVARPRPSVFWVGLKNTGNAPRAFCGLGVEYSYETADGTIWGQSTEQYPVVGSPHRCSSSWEPGHLVLAGDTHFVKVRVPLPPEAVPGTLRISIVAEETCVTTERCEHRGRSIRVSQ